MHQATDKNINQIEALLIRYGFEIKQVTITELIEAWLQSYSVYWIRLAIVEALSQGRYKAISVEHILALWKRLGHPTYHFTYEFERFITRNVFMEELTHHKVIESHENTENKQTIDKPPEDTPKNKITLTPVKELVKNIATPVSISSSKISTNTDKIQIKSHPITKDLETETNNNKGNDTNGQKADLDPMTLKTKTNTFTPSLCLVASEIATAENKTISLDNNHFPGSIHKFVPHCDSSDFYGKLRAVAHQKSVKIE
ncbi:MAG: hypothetical protein WBM32_24035 [Crocosphaera sp.]